MQRCCVVKLVRMLENNGTETTFIDMPPNKRNELASDGGNDEPRRTFATSSGENDTSDLLSALDLALHPGVNAWMAESPHKICNIRKVKSCIKLVYKIGIYVNVYIMKNP